MDNRYQKYASVFHQGMFSSQGQVSKYTGGRETIATTGEVMSCSGKNGFPPLNVIFNPYIGCEIADVNLNPFDSFTSTINPINFIGAGIFSFVNWWNNIHISPAENPRAESVAYHAPILANISIGQVTDIASHQSKIAKWRSENNINNENGIILFGVSRGTAATFNAFATHKYPEVKMVILEGAIDSLPNVFKKRFPILGDAIESLFECFTQYKSDGDSPLNLVDEYPANVPTVFITSEIDQEVPCENTERIAKALADRGTNDVYLLVLKRSSHTGYMYDNAKDRHYYNCLINAMYKKIGAVHNAELAAAGEELGLIEACKITPHMTKTYDDVMAELTRLNDNCLSAKDSLNKPNWMQTFFGMNNTLSWQSEAGKIRIDAWRDLKRSLSYVNDKAEKLRILTAAKKLPLFHEHRSNYDITQKTEQTTAVIRLDEEINDIKRNLI